MVRKVGVLALQGGFSLHAGSIYRAGAKSLEVRTAEDLKQCDALVIPGGESTVLAKLLKETGMDEGIVEFSKKYPVMGTCAGLILLSSGIVDHSIKPLGLIDIYVERNAYGRQQDSFISDITLAAVGMADPFEGVFIRAPKISGIGRGVKILAQMEENVVMARSDNILVTTFHPELTQDTRIHTFFMERFMR